MRFARFFRKSHNDRLVHLVESPLYYPLDRQLCFPVKIQRIQQRNQFRNPQRYSPRKAPLEWDGLMKLDFFPTKKSFPRLKSRLKSPPSLNVAIVIIYVGAHKKTLVFPPTRISLIALVWEEKRAKFWMRPMLVVGWMARVEGECRFWR